MRVSRINAPYVCPVATAEKSRLCFSRLEKFEANLEEIKVKKLNGFKDAD